MAIHEGDVEVEQSKNVRYSEAASRICSHLWIEREKANQNNNRQSSPLQDVLEEIWGRIVHDSFEHEKMCKVAGYEFQPLDKAHVDGTIYEVANDFEKTVQGIVEMRKLIKPMTWNVISRDLEEYAKAVAHVRYKVISTEGRHRLGLWYLGEKE